jgi:CBS domain-containing protein
MQARDIMNRDVVTFAPATTVAEAATTLATQHISGAPVVAADGTVVGMVTEGDLWRRPEIGTERRHSWWEPLFADSGTLAKEYIKSHGHKVEDVMTRDIVTVDEEAPLGEVVALLERKRIKRVPVLAAGKLVGLISRGDIVRLVAEAEGQRGTSPPPRNDDEIRRLITERMRAEPWIAGAPLNVMVRDGRVEITGWVQNEAQRHALEILVEDVPGVRELRNHATVMARTTPATV